MISDASMIWRAPYSIPDRIVSSLRYQMRDTSVKVFEIIPSSTDTELWHERRANKNETHGGVPISEFLEEAMEAIKNDLLTAPIGISKGMFAKRDELFSLVNK